MAPFSGTEFDMLANEFEKETVGIVIKHAKEKAKARKASGVYARLLAAGQRLMTVIRHNEGGANKEWRSLQIRSIPCVISGTADCREAAIKLL